MPFLPVKKFLNFKSCRNNYVQFVPGAGGSESIKFCGGIESAKKYSFQSCSNTLQINYATVEDATLDVYTGFRLYFESKTCYISCSNLLHSLNFFNIFTVTDEAPAYCTGVITTTPSGINPNPTTDPAALNVISPSKTKILMKNSYQALNNLQIIN